MEVKKNRFLEDFSEEKRPLGFYLLGSLIVLIFSFIGQIPMFFFLPNEINTSLEGLDIFSSLDKNLLLFLLLLPSVFSFLGLWFVVNNGLIDISNDAPIWLVGPGNINSNPLGGFYGINLLIFLIFYIFVNVRKKYVR